MNGISFVIPNRNGEKLLKENLPFLLSEIKNIECKEIIIADDFSTDSSIAMIRKDFPEIRVITSEKPLGFSENCNKGVYETKYDTVVCLNTDVRVSSGFLAPLLKVLQEPEVFAVSPKILKPEQDSYINESLCKTFYGFGLFYHSGIPEKKLLKDPPVCSIPFACGAAIAFKKNFFMELKGFDTLYSPFYWEDFDLCYRAWKKGWKTLYQSESSVYHLHRGTISRLYKQIDVEIIHERNRFLFVWKNVIDPLLIAEHFLFLPAKLIESLLQGRYFFLTSFLEALKKFPETWKKRKREKEEAKFGDREILKLYSKIYKNLYV